MKAEIKNLAIKASQRHAKPKKYELEKLKKEFDKLQELIEKNEDSEDQAERYEHVQHKSKEKKRKETGSAQKLINLMTKNQQNIFLNRRKKVPKPNR